MGNLGSLKKIFKILYRQNFNCKMVVKFWSINSVKILLMKTDFLNNIEIWHVLVTQMIFMLVNHLVVLVLVKCSLFSIVFQKVRFHSMILGIRYSPFSNIWYSVFTKVLVSSVMYSIISTQYL